MTSSQSHYSPTCLPQPSCKERHSFRVQPLREKVAGRWGQQLTPGKGIAWGLARGGRGSLGPQTQHLSLLHRSCSAHTLCAVTDASERWRCWPCRWPASSPAPQTRSGSRSPLPISGSQRVLLSLSLSPPCSLLGRHPGIHAALHPLLLRGHHPGPHRLLQQRQGIPDPLRRHHPADRWYVGPGKAKGRGVGKCQASLEPMGCAISKAGWAPRGRMGTAGCKQQAREKCL